MQKIILDYPKLKSRIESRENSEKEKLLSLKHLEGIRAQVTPSYVKLVIKILDAILFRLYDGIKLDGALDEIKGLSKDDCVVFVSNHQSHADYIAINYIFYKTFLNVLYVAGGQNLNIFPIGPLFKRLGCFFIRRTFASDITYKLTLEAYLYYLLKKRRKIEFFFEGGRSRTGKLRPPRFGLYGMLFDAYHELAKESEQKLIFVPVSIAHEAIPETKSLIKEVRGGKKKKESTRQLLNLFKIFSYRFGTVHIRLGKPFKVENMLKEMSDHQSFKTQVQDLAFKCFREVGNNMIVTPTSLLALILLDEASGAMLWQDILSKSKAIINHCWVFHIPHSESLNEEKWKKSLERAMDILVGNRKVDVISQQHSNKVYYSIREECREEVLYHKNMILHHFLIPSIMSQIWINLFSGEIQSISELKEFFLEKRNQLKHEFYLPTVKQFFYGTLEIIGYIIGRKILHLEELINFSNQEFYKAALHLGVFNRFFSHISEAYYISGLTLKSLNQKYPEGFKVDTYHKRFRTIFNEELKLGRLIRYQEGGSTALISSSLKYFTHLKLIENQEGVLKLVNQAKLEALVNQLEKDLINQITFNIRAFQL